MYERERFAWQDVDFLSVTVLYVSLVVGTLQGVEVFIHLPFAASIFSKKNVLLPEFFERNFYVKTYIEELSKYADL